MLKRIALWLILSLIFPVSIRAQSADSLRLLWKNEAISGVTAHAFSHSGNVLALASNHEIMFWDLKAGRFVRTISIPSHNYDQMAFNQTDEEIVLLSPPEIPHFSDCGFGQQRPAVGCEIRVDLRTEKADEIREASIKKGKWALSPDGSIIALLTDSGKLSIRDSRDFSIHSSVMFPPVSTSYLADVYSGWIPPYGVWFSPNGNDVITLWGGQAVVFDAFSLPNHKIITDSVDKWRSPYIKGEGVFIPEEKSSQAAEMLSEVNYEPSDLQPPIAYVPDVSKWTDTKGKTNRPKSAILFGNGKYLASRYAVWLEHLIDYGTARGEDTLIITSPSHPEFEWGIKLSNFMEVLDVVPGNKNQLLLGDGESFKILDASTHEITELPTSPVVMDCFNSGGDEVVVHNSRGIRWLDAKYGKPVRSVQFAEQTRFSVAPGGCEIAITTDASNLTFLDSLGHTQGVYSSNGTWPFADAFANDTLAFLNRAVIEGRDYSYYIDLYNIRQRSIIREETRLGKGYETRILKIDTNTVLVWGVMDTALIFDFLNDSVVATFVGGLNHGIADAAISHDRKWLVTVDPFRGTKLWRVSDGQLTMDFQLDGHNDARNVQFSPNDRYLLYCSDSEFYARDLLNGETKSILHFGTNPNVSLCQDGSKFVAWNWNQMIALYETPSIFRDPTQPIDPKTVYLPLRFYLPNDAPDALDSTGAKYNPPRTHVELELRYADGRLLEKILDGAYHKGKWHLWEYDMTKYPKGTYIMHTEIGGVVKDEKMEVR